ncbi:MAG: glycine--tRNA ligase [Candidatus Bathyarchaeota archaeon]
MADKTKPTERFTAVNELARRRGFFWQSYEIYGGVGGFITYGFLGTKLKQNIEQKVRENFGNKLGIFEIESPIITPRKILEASGHIDSFKEPMVECLDCKRSFRAYDLMQQSRKIKKADLEKLTLEEVKNEIIKHKIRCQECSGSLGEPREFLTMFKTSIGPYSGAEGYGRPEAAQGIFVEFKRLYDLAREKLPFGVLQVGHALRNEISPRQGPIRLREFTIMDLEFFFDPENPKCFLLEELKDEKLPLVMAENRLHGSEKAENVSLKDALKKGYIKTEWQAVFMILAKKLLMKLGVSEERQRFIEKLPWESAHYALQSFDQEVHVDRWGWIEVSGHVNRTDYDLRSHIKTSGSDLRAYKSFEEPIDEISTSLKPLMEKLGPTFKGEAEKVAKRLLNVNPAEVEASLNETGRYKIEGYIILPEHVEIKHVKTKKRGKHFIPHVVEPSFGSDRLVYVALESAYTIRDGRVLLSFPRDIAPIQIGVYPLVSKDGLPEKASEICQMLKNHGFIAEYDEAGSIGRRYARADEIGIPLGITIDYETFEDDTVTIRDRDSWKQVRSQTKELPELLNKYFCWKTDFIDLGRHFKN